MAVMYSLLILVHWHWENASSYVLPPKTNISKLALLQVLLTDLLYVQYCQGLQMPRESSQLPFYKCH